MRAAAFTMSICPKVIRGIAGARRLASLSLPARTTYAVSRSIPAMRLHVSAPASLAKPTNPDPRENPAHELAPKGDVNVGRKRFADFDIAGRVFIVTGGARGLGLTLAEGLVEAGGKGKWLHLGLLRIILCSGCALLK